MLRYENRNIVRDIAGELNTYDELSKRSMHAILPPGYLRWAVIFPNAAKRILGAIALTGRVAHRSRRASAVGRTASCRRSSVLRRPHHPAHRQSAAGATRPVVR